MVSEAHVTLSVTGWQVLSFVVATVLPLLVGLVTTRVTSPGVRATLLLALSAVTGLLTELLEASTSSDSYDLGQGLLTALTVFVVGVAMHFGLWKPTGASSAAIAVGSRP